MLQFEPNKKQTNKKQTNKKQTNKLISISELRLTYLWKKQKNKHEYFAYTYMMS